MKFEGSYKKVVRFMALFLMISLVLPFVVSCIEDKSEKETFSETQKHSSETVESSKEPETETEDPWDEGKLEPDFDITDLDNDPEKEPAPQNPSRYLYSYCFLNKVGTDKITVLSKYVKGLDYDVYAERDAENKIYYIYLPCRVDLSKVTFSVTHTNGVESGPYTVDFSDDKFGGNEYTIGTTSKYKIIALQTNLPSVMLQVDEKYGTIKSMNESEKHSVHVYGDMTATVTNEMAAENGWATRYVSVDEDSTKHCSVDIRGRGNATWNCPKKPYQFKLEAPINLFGMGSGKTYCFISNYRDATLVRSQFALTLAQQMKIRYVSDSRQVDFFLNGKYMGTYLLCEKVEQGENRIEIDKNEDFLYEVDQYHDESGPFGFLSAKGVKLTIHSPDDTKKIAKAIKTLNICESFLYQTDSDKYLEFFDLDSWVRMFFLQQTTMNSDSYLGSFYFYYDSSEGKMVAIAPWDFDLSLGVSWHEALENPKTYNVADYGWMKPLYKHKSFRKAAVEMYYEGGFRELIQESKSLFAELSGKLERAYPVNEKGAAVYYYPEGYETTELALEYAFEVIDRRLVYVDRFMKHTRYVLKTSN